MTRDNVLFAIVGLLTGLIVGFIAANSLNERGTATPTARQGIDPTLGAATPNPFVELSTPIPEPMPQLFLDKDVVNILLLGRDTAKENAAYRTDVMIVVSVHKANNTVALLTLPRDLFVYIPGWTMNRLNTASGYGDAIDYPGGGVALLEHDLAFIPPDPPYVVVRTPAV